MTKDEFFSRMEKGLASLPANERFDILGDYVEHFRAGEETGKTAEEIAAALGSPEELAATYLEGRGAPSAVPYPAPGPVRAAAAGYTQPAPPPPAGPVRPPYSGVPASGGYAPPATSDNQAIATIVVILFNLFIGLPVIGALIGVFIAVPFVALGLLVAAVTLFVLTGLAGSVNPALGGATVCIGVALLALAVLLAVAAIALVRLLVLGMRKYVQFCIRICREGRWPS